MADASAGYEFDAGQKEIIDRVEMAFKVLSIFLLVQGIVELVGALDDFGAHPSLHGRMLFEGLIYVVTSRYLRRAARALDQVAKATGNGIPKLMEGLGAIRDAIRFFGYAALIIVVLRAGYVAATFAANHFGAHPPS